MFSSSFHLSLSSSGGTEWYRTEQTIPDGIHPLPNARTREGIPFQQVPHTTTTDRDRTRTRPDGTTN